MINTMYVKTSLSQQPVWRWLLDVRKYHGVARVDVSLLFLSLMWLVVNANTVVSEFIRWASEGPSVSSLSVVLSVMAAALLVMLFAKSYQDHEQILQEASDWVLSEAEWREFAHQLVSSSIVAATLCASLSLMLCISALTSTDDFLLFGLFPLLLLSVSGMAWHLSMVTKMTSVLQSGGRFVAQTVVDNEAT